MIIIKIKQHIQNNPMTYPEYLLSILSWLWVLWCSLAILYLFLWKPYFELAINESSSLPQKLFLIVKHHTIHRGDYIAFYPPKNPLYKDREPFIKIVGGCEGDRVIRKGRNYYIGFYLMGRAYRVSEHGKKLSLGPTGKIGKNEYYVYANNPKSYDSRYKDIGWISKDRIIGRAYPIF